MVTRRTKEFDQRLAMKLYKEGKGWREIAKIVGVHPYSIQFWFNSQGLKTKNPIKRKWDVDKARELKEQGLSYRKIAKEIGVSFSAIQKALSEEKSDDKRVAGRSS